MITEVELQRLLDKADERLREQLVSVTDAIAELQTAVEALQQPAKKPITKS